MDTVKVKDLEFKVRQRAGLHRAGGEYWDDDAPDDTQTWYAESLFGRYTAYETFNKSHRFAVCPGVKIHEGKLMLTGTPYKMKATSLDHARQLCNEHYQKIASEVREYL